MDKPFNISGLQVLPFGNKSALPNKAVVMNMFCYVVYDVGFYDTWWFSNRSLCRIIYVSGSACTSDLCSFNKKKIFKHWHMAILPQNIGYKFSMHLPSFLKVVYSLKSLSVLVTVLHFIKSKMLSIIKSSGSYFKLH